MSYNEFETFEQKTFNDAIRYYYDKQTSKTSEEKYLYLCFCPERYDNFTGKPQYFLWQKPYVNQYNFIFELSEHIQELEKKPSKTNIRRADLLKNLVHKLYNISETKSKLSSISDAIEKFHKNHAKELGKHFIFPSKTSKFLGKMIGETSKIQTGVSFKNKINYKCEKLEDFTTTDKERHIDPVLAKCVVNEKVKNFQKLIKDRVVEERKKILSKRGFLTKVLHFFMPPLKKAYVNKKLKFLNDGLEKYKKLSSTEEVLKQVKSEKKSDSESTNVFGDTTVGKKLSNIWNGFKSAFKKATEFLTKKEREIEKKDLEEKSKKKLIEKKKCEKEKKRRLMEQKKQQDQEKQRKLIAKKKMFNDEQACGLLKKTILSEKEYGWLKGYLGNLNNKKLSNLFSNLYAKKVVGGECKYIVKKEREPRRYEGRANDKKIKSYEPQNQNTGLKQKRRKRNAKRQNNCISFFDLKLYSKHIKEICFDQQPQQQFGVIKVTVKNSSYWMRQYIDQKTYMKCQKSPNIFLQKISECYDPTCGTTTGFEFNEAKFNKNFSGNNKNVKRTFVNH
ncbi:MAG: hypothetical protein PVG30_01025 [Gammaproteobacteria bacterium]|jgi:hypothetical protein